MKDVNDVKFESVKVGDVIKWTYLKKNNIYIVVRKTSYNVTLGYIIGYGISGENILLPQDFSTLRHQLMNVEI